MKIFITGGTGFIGKHLIRALLKEGHEVHFLFRDKKKAQIFDNTNAIPHEGRIEDVRSYQKIFDQDIEVIYHLAAISGQKWGFSKKDYYRLNVQATADLLEVCHNKIKRFIFSSSINALSKNNRFERDEYGKSKWLAEKKVEEYQQKGLETIIIRPAVVYGPGDIQGMMLKLCQLIKKKEFYLIGKGRNIVPFVYVDDLIKAFLKAKDIPQTGGIYEIVGPDLLSIKDTATKIADMLQINLSKKIIPVWLAQLTAYFSEITFWLLKKEPLITRHRIDIVTKHKPLGFKKAQQELGYRPKVNFADGIKKTISWYQENGYL